VRGEVLRFVEQQLPGRGVRLPIEDPTQIECTELFELAHSLLDVAHSAADRGAMGRGARTPDATGRGVLARATPDEGILYSVLTFRRNGERFGQHKRDILVSRVRSGQEDQREAEEQFLTTYQVFKEVAGFDGGDLEEVYDRMNREFLRSEERAERVRKRIDSIEDVAEDLFREWQGEIELISSRDLRRRSETSLRDTRQRYDTLIRAMKRAEARMDPVLVAFRDQVLFVKHNLNARAISSLEGSVSEIESEVEQLIQDMRRAIREAEVFLESMES
jgi:hypothetical protein